MCGTETTTLSSSYILSHLIYCPTGLMTGHKMIGIRMVLQDGASHSVDSSELAFRQAAIGAIRQAFPQATPTVLEPIMSVEVVAPDEFQVRDLVCVCVCVS